MRVIRFFILAVLFFPVFAVADSGDDMHLQSAFIFAKKKQWQDAIAHARAAHSDVLEKYFFWEYLKDPEADASFRDISEFLANNPEWPDKELLVRRAEAALLSEMPSDEVLDKWYEEHPPKTTQGKKRKITDKNELKELIRESWVNDDYTKAAEAKMLAHYRDILRPEDHAKRVDRLLWEGKQDEAKRLIPYALIGKRKLFEARLSLMRDSPRAPKDLANVPAAQRGDAGLLYDRIRWRLRHDDKDGAKELMIMSPQQVPYPEKWWTIRERFVRESLGENKVAVAEKLLSHHGLKEDMPQYMEAVWLKGWIALEFRNNPKAAFDIFQKLYDDLETPGSRARAAYWAGRAAEKTGDKAGAWYQEASKYNTTFYGQVALMELSDNPTLTIKADDSDATREDKKKFGGRELVRLVQELARAKQTSLAGKFILFMVESAKNTREAVLAAQLGREIKRIDIGVRASKKALRDGVVALDSGYPVIRIDETQGLEKSYLLALMRQESEFFADAVSSSGALGLMQLLPGTAREIARKMGLLPFVSDRLFDPSYNITIGSKYLSSLVTRFNGSYVLATAGYNAGPGRVRQWLSAFGYPGGSYRNIINWIEVIPLSETRNYVQHVMGNMQVYRYILAGRKPTPLSLEDDLSRGGSGN